MPRIKREPLTLKVINAARATERLYRLRDATVPGLVLRVTPNGTKTWAVTWGRGQERIVGTWPTMTLEGAREAARRELGEIATHGAPLAVVGARKRSAAVDTFGDFMADRYGPHVLATAKAGKATVHCIKAQFGHLYDRKLTSIARADFDDFKAKRLKAGTHPATVNRDLDRLKAALNQAVAWDLLDKNPLAGVKRIKRDIEDRVRFLSPAEEKRLRAALAKRDDLFRRRRVSANAWRDARGKQTLPELEGYADHITPMTLVALNTGCRRGEITQLTWADIDLKRKLLTVRAGYAKSGKARHIPLNSEAVSVLKTWKRRQPEGRLFHLDCNAKAWGRLMEAAKIEDFRFHDLRHTFASKLVMAGVALNTVRELLGHADIKMTLRYAHLAQDTLADAVARLA
jgi:integrase